MDTLTPVQLFVAHYIVAGLTAFCLLLKNGEGISLKLIGYTGFYSLIGGTFAPVIADLPHGVAISKAKLGFAYAAGIGAGIVVIPKLKLTNIKQSFKSWVNEDDDASKKD